MFAENLGMVRTLEIWPSLLVTFVLGLSGFILLYLLIGDRHKAGLILTVFLLWFFSYGHVYRVFLLPYDRLTGTPISFNVFLFLVSLPLLAWVFFKLWRMASPLKNGTKIFNFITLVLLIFPVFDILHSSDGEQSEVSLFEEVVFDEPTLPDTLPDIYVIVLDAYARQDVLADLYRFDNQPFLGELQEKGFQVAKESVSNYRITVASMASMLNFDYLHPQKSSLSDQSAELAPLTNAIRESRSVRFLASLGYKTVSYDACTFQPAQFSNADQFIKTPGFNLSNFEAEVLDTTPIIPLMSKIFGVEKTKFILREKKIRYALQNTGLEEEGPPLMVVSHVVSPHPPFLFSADGSLEFQPYKTTDLETFQTNYRKGYVAQLQYVNSEVEKAIDRIKARKRPAVIAVLSDHGPQSQMLGEGEPLPQLVRETFPNLMAFRFPGNERASLPSDISLVNTMPIILNQLFDLDLPLAQRRCFFSKLSRPYQLKEVTEELE